MYCLSHIIGLQKAPTYIFVQLRILCVSVLRADTWSLFRLKMIFWYVKYESMGAYRYL